MKTISTHSGTDAELLVQYKQSGELAVLASLYQRYMDLVYGVCLKYLSDTESSRDAVMIIFDELSQKVMRHDIDNFKSWLYMVTKNHCLMKLRSIKSKKMVEFQPDFMQTHINGHLQSEVLEREESYKTLELCIETLPEEQKAAVQLFYLKNKCYNEIVEITGIEWNKVRSHIQNGRRNLKICMEQNSNK